MKAIEVILLETIPRLGKAGDRVRVRAGFARNFLLPRGKVLRANQANLAFFEERRKAIETNDLEARDKAKKDSIALKGLIIDIIRQAGDRGQLYGSVSGRDLAAQLKDRGYPIDRNQIGLNQPIKILGLHSFDLRLHPEVSMTLTVNVARNQEEADVQRKLGRSVLIDQDNDEVNEDISSISESSAPPATDHTNYDINP